MVEEAQQPWRPWRKLGRGSKGIPHLHGAANELIAAWAFHAVHTEVCAANSHGIFGRPGSRRIVFRSDQAMARINRCGYRRSQVNVAQPQDQVTGTIHDAVYLIDGSEAVDAANKLDIAGTPGRVRPHALHVLSDGQLSSRIVPGQRQMNHA